MAGRETADILFCMDASGSMDHIFKSVSKHVNKLIDSLKSDLQRKWDVRFDFLAYSDFGGAMRFQTVNCSGAKITNGIYGKKSLQEVNGQQESKTFFTRDIDKFKNALESIECHGDEASGIALDVCADFPFRDAATCHRVIVLLTDEPIRTGTHITDTERKILDIAKKLQDRRIALFMVTPDCPTYDELSQTDRCEWIVDNSGSLENVDFSKLMETIGKSVSVSQTSGTVHDKPNPNFGQDKWTTASIYSEHSVAY